MNISSPSLPAPKARRVASSIPAIGGACSGCPCWRPTIYPLAHAKSGLPGDCCELALTLSPSAASGMPGMLACTVILSAVLCSPVIGVSRRVAKAYEMSLEKKDGNQTEEMEEGYRQNRYASTKPKPVAEPATCSEAGAQPGQKKRCVSAFQMSPIKRIALGQISKKRWNSTSNKRSARKQRSIR